MLKMFKKSIWILCEDITASPNIQKIRAEIAKYCASNQYAYDFISDNEVVIKGIVHEIRCVRSAFSRGRYVIKCREK